MNDVALARLRNQRLVGAPLAKPEDVVRSLGAVQSQDFPGAKWALGLRLKNGTDETVEDAFTAGRILRTHVMRPTWHFVLPEDIRWLLDLTAPRVKVATKYYDRMLELDPTTIRRCHAVIKRALRGGTHLTRAEVAGRLEAAGIEARGQRLAHIVMHAELDALVCSGPRRGKQFTYALLGERAPGAPTMSRDDALAELTRRYFTSHGPAQIRDFTWWSGLTVADARRGVERAGRALRSFQDGKKSYWHAPSRRSVTLDGPVAHLLPNFDEYVVAYKDRSDFFEHDVAERVRRTQGVLDNHIVLLDGMVVGGWRWMREKAGIRIELRLLTRIGRAGTSAIDEACQRLAAFLDERIAVSSTTL